MCCFVLKDLAHLKKSFPAKLLRFKKAYDWSDAEGYGDIRKFTEKYARLLTDRMFSLAFHDASVTTVGRAKTVIHDVLTHYCPADDQHTNCFKEQFTWCKTAFGSAQNTSSALKSALPVGFGALLEEWLYSEVLDDTLIEILIRPGCTSLNEACNHVINLYAKKSRFLGALSYKHAVARGVLQWNAPYAHLVEELKSFGIIVSEKHNEWVRRTNGTSRSIKRNTICRNRVRLHMLEDAAHFLDNCLFLFSVLIFLNPLDVVKIVVDPPDPPSLPFYNLYFSYIILFYLILSDF